MPAAPRLLSPRFNALCRFSFANSAFHVPTSDFPLSRTGKSSTLRDPPAGFTCFGASVVPLSEGFRLPCSFHELLIPTPTVGTVLYSSSLLFDPSRPPQKKRCRGRRRCQWYRLASVRRSNPACGSPALGFHNSMLFSIVPTKVSVKQGLPTLTRRIVFFQAMFSNHSTANVCCAVTRCVAQSIGPVG